MYTPLAFLFIFRHKKRISALSAILSYFTILNSPYGNRTRDSAVRGQRLNPLTNGPFACTLTNDITFVFKMQVFFQKTNTVLMLS